MTRFLPRLLVLLALAAAGAHAQTTAPAKMGITRGTVPEVLQVLDHGNTWVTIGNVDSTGHAFMLPTAQGGTGVANPNLTAGMGIGIVGSWPNQVITNTSPGSVQPGLLYVTDPSVGMVPGGPDNAPRVGALMNAIGPYPAPAPISAHYGHNAAYFPPVPGQAQTVYYFGSGPLSWSRQSSVSCGNSGSYQPTMLVFEAGYDGFVDETYGSGIWDGGSSATSTITGCGLASLGNGSAYAQPGETQIHGVTMPTFGPASAPIGPTKWTPGDGVLATPQRVERLQPLAVNPGAYVASVSSDQTTLTLGSGDPLNGAGPYIVHAGGTAFGPVRANSVTGTLTGNTLNVTAVSGGSITVGQYIWDYNHSIWAQITAFGTGTGGTGTYTVSSPFNTNASVAYVGVQTLTGATISGTTLTFTGLNGGTIIPGQTYITDVFPTGYGGVIPAGTIITAQTGGTTGGAGTYTINNSIGSFSGVLFGGEPYNASPSGSFTATSYGFNQLQLLRLPASLAYKVETTVGSSTVTVDSGPNICLGPSAQLWSDAFLYGAQVRTSTCVSVANNGSISYPYTVTVAGLNVSPLMNATIAHTSGSPGNMWSIPSGINRKVVSYAENNFLTGWGTALKMNCSTAHGYNCTGSRDRNNYYQFNFIGRLDSGNNLGASGVTDELFLKSYVADIINNAQPNINYTDVSADSYENGYAPMSVSGVCTSYPATFNGGYTSGYFLHQAGSYCMPTTTNSIVIPDGSVGLATLGKPLFIGQTANTPIDSFRLNGGSLLGQFQFQGATTGKATYSGSAITSGTNPGVTSYQWWPGMTIQDLTNPQAIPAGTTIASVSIAGAPTMSNAVVNPPGIQNKDVIQITSTVAGASPCVRVQGGLEQYSGIEIGRTSGCTNGDWRLGWDGYRNAWDWYPSSQGAGRPALGFTNAGVYAGYNDFAVGNHGVFANNGVMLGSGSTLMFTDRLLAGAAAAPTGASTTFTAAQAYLSTSQYIALTGGSVTGATVEYALVDNTSNKILGTINSTGTNTTTNWATLTANAAFASSAQTDQLSFAGGANLAALDYFGTTQTMIPLNGACTNVGGQVTDTTTGQVIGTVSACGTFATIKIREPAGSASTGAADSLMATNALDGNVFLNQAPVAGGYAGWINTAHGNNYRPFGLVANNTAGDDITIKKTLRSGNSANVDMVGRIALTSGTKTFTLGNTYTTAPVCFCADATTPANACSVSETTTVLTFTGTGSDTVKWHCIGQN